MTLFPVLDPPKDFPKYFLESVCRVLAVVDKCVYTNHITATIPTNKETKNDDSTRVFRSMVNEVQKPRIDGSRRCGKLSN